MNIPAQQPAADRSRAAPASLFELSPTASLVCSEDGLRVLTANQAALDLLGRDRGHLLEAGLPDLLQRADGDAAGGGEDTTLTNPAPDGLWLYPHTDGVVRILECTSRALDFDGQPAWLLSLHDQTRQRQAVRVLEASEQRYRDLFANIGSYVCTHSMDGKLLSANPAAAKALGYSMDDLLRLPLSRLLQPEYRGEFAAYLAHLHEHGSAHGLAAIRHHDGSRRAWQYRSRLYEDVDGAQVVIASAQDITELRTAEMSAKRSEQLVRTIADALPLRVAYLDAGLRFVFVNGLFERLFKRTSDEIVGLHVSEVLSPGTLEARLPYLKQALAGKHQQFQITRGHGPDQRYEEFTVLPELASDKRTVRGVYVMAQDITAQKHEKRRLVQLAQVDGLTGLLNRSGLMDRLDRAIKRCADQDSTLVLMYLDLDGFKQANDWHGHAVGDWLLKKVGQRLQKTVRTSDVVARLGGDEFVLMMEGMHDMAIIEATAGRLVEVLAQPFASVEATGAIPITIGASVGVAVQHGACESANELLQRADAAMYAAKRDGRGTWRMAGKHGLVPARAVPPRSLVDA